MWQNLARSKPSVMYEPETIQRWIEFVATWDQLNGFAATKNPEWIINSPFWIIDSLFKILNIPRMYKSPIKNLSVKFQLPQLIENQTKCQNQNWLKIKMTNSRTYCFQPSCRRNKTFEICCVLLILLAVWIVFSVQQEVFYNSIHPLRTLSLFHLESLL